jgi:hypothetical protein
MSAARRLVSAKYRHNKSSGLPYDAARAEAFRENGPEQNFGAIAQFTCTKTIAAILQYELMKQRACHRPHSL